MSNGKILLYFETERDGKLSVAETVYCEFIPRVGEYVSIGSVNGRVKDVVYAFEGSESYKYSVTLLIG